MKTCGLYIHIPFCVSKCKYCDFNSYAGFDNKQKEYVFALAKEISNISTKSKLKIDTIYIGGGTPSTLFSGAITTIMSEVKKHYDIVDGAEITIEANPNSITMSKALEWVEAGINRVSVGLQTTKSGALKVIGRAHTKKDYVRAMQILHDAGFNNINTDLMIGLPKQKSSDVRYAIHLCNKLESNHISCYSLIIEDNTPLSRMVKSGKVKLPKEEKTIGMYITALNNLTKLGYIHYEVSNFAKKTYECRHNLNCWSMKDYIGFGAGAHSFVNNVRYSNEKSIDKYIEKINLNQSVVVDNQSCSKQDLYEETIMLGLRKREGISISKLDNLLGERFVEKYKSSIDKYLKLNYIVIDNDVIRVTNNGIFVLNQIILDFVM